MKILLIKTKRALDAETKSKLDELIVQNKKLSAVSFSHRWNGSNLQVRTSAPPAMCELEFAEQEIIVHLDCPRWVLALITPALQQQAIATLAGTLQTLDMIESAKDISTAVAA